VHDIRSTQVKKGRQTATTLAYRHVEFISGYDAEFGIPNLPPPLLADDLHVQC
jgi:hypothetical protein